MEEIAKKIAFHLSSVVEIVAATVIAIALIKFVYNYAARISNKNEQVSNGRLRVKFGSSLALALELMLAADILITAVAPSWEDIGKLASIAAIRTALNYFLEKELKQIDTREEGM